MFDSRPLDQRALQKGLPESAIVREKKHSKRIEDGLLTRQEDSNFPSLHSKLITQIKEAKVIDRQATGFSVV